MSPGCLLFLTEGVFDWHSLIVHVCACLTFSSESKSAGLSRWTLVDGFFAVGLQQCQWTRVWALRAKTARGRVDRERDQEKTSEQAIFMQDRSRDEGGILPPSQSRNLLCLLFSPAKGTTKLSRGDDRSFLSSLQFVYIPENKLWPIGTLYNYTELW